MSGDRSGSCCRAKDELFSPMMRPLIEMISVGLFILAVGTGQPEWQGSGTNEWLALDRPCE